jgi:lysine-N-methylase
MAAKILFDPCQKFDCRDCPARCCRLPVAIPLNAEEVARFTEEPWVRERLGDEGMAWIAKGLVPTRDANRILQCAFLDDDELCSMQKKLGHDFLPQTCKSFPFGFVSNEKDQLVAQMSQLCPSIRDGYGELITVQRLRDKLSQKGGSERMSKAMATRHGRILSQAQYMRVVRKWVERLEQDKPPLEVLLELYDWTKAFEDSLPGSSEKPDDAAVTEAFARADEAKLVRFQLSTSTPFQARMLHTYVLGGLSYPSRVMLEHRLDQPPPFQGLRALWTKIKWALCRGTVDLIYVRNPVPLRKVDAVQRFLSGEKARPISRLLRLIVERRQIFRDPRHMMEVIMDMALSTIVISRYARCRAASEGRSEVEDADVKEGISVVELALLGHASQRGAGATLRNTRRTLIAARENFLRMLASENDPS